MRLTWLVAAAVSQILSPSAVEASFLRDVVRRTESQARKMEREGGLEDILLSKAVPIEEYKANLRAKGIAVPANLDLPSELRRLDADEDGEEGDDYYVNSDYMISFSGYSLKYARCQPVQRFSEDAIIAGEYSPMITDDIVILRLCPYRFCSSSRTYGCSYNFAEYAIDVKDYTRVMIRYAEDKEEQLCDWCDSCYARRRLDDAGDDQEQDQADEDEDAQDDAVQNDNDANNQYYNTDDTADNYSDNACYNYQSYCSDEYGNALCDQDGDDSYMQKADYINYLDCVKVADEDKYSYYVRPRCDASAGTIKMAVFHDKFCAQYAGNEVSLNSFGLGFQESAFEEFYTTNTCIDCSQSNSPPYFNANHNMCNSMHQSGAKCATNLQYDLFDTDGTDSTECSFVESIRYGTYDESGSLYLEGSIFGGSSREVTEGQTIGLALTIAFCSLLAIYSCYLHHSITNLLIKSLSHSDLLPPSRHKTSVRGRSSSRGKIKRGGRSQRRAHEDDDWDMVGTPA